MLKRPTFLLQNHAMRANKMLFVKGEKAVETWFVYILQCGDGTLYCGVTNNIARRILCHNRGRGARYTRGRTPVTLLGHASFLGRAEAQRVEYRIKQQPASRKVAFLASLGKEHFVGSDAASVPTEGLSWNLK